MALPSLLSFKGGKLSGVALTGADIKSILPKVTDRPYTIIFYYDIPDKLIDGINVILFIYPGASYGHWCFLDINKAAKKAYFFDPYGNPPDGQWTFLNNPDKRPAPEFKLSEYIRDLVEKQRFKFNRNTYNLQGSLRNGHIADSACGEIILYRILKHHMTDFEFYNECIELGAKKIYEFIKSLSDE
jgi:hypothetical protein